MRAAILLLYSTDFRTQRLFLADTAIHRQQGGPDANGGRVADLRRDRGRERMAESQRSEHLAASGSTSVAPRFLCSCLISALASPQAETTASSSACTVHVAHSFHQTTTLFLTRVRNWRHSLQVISSQVSKAKSEPICPQLTLN